ncbi:MAG: hypothetical protein MZV70_00140 [Desulfobacterales bacterium]|nr:hypothetical protein [Desulfobacterales bacterium]
MLKDSRGKHQASSCAHSVARHAKRRPAVRLGVRRPPFAELLGHPQPDPSAAGRDLDGGPPQGPVLRRDRRRAGMPLDRADPTPQPDEASWGPGVRRPSTARFHSCSRCWRPRSRFRSRPTRARSMPGRGRSSAKTAAGSPGCAGAQLPRPPSTNRSALRADALLGCCAVSGPCRQSSRGSGRLCPRGAAEGNRRLRRSTRNSGRTATSLFGRLLVAGRPSGAADRRVSEAVSAVAGSARTTSAWTGSPLLAAPLPGRHRRPGARADERPAARRRARRFSWPRAFCTPTCRARASRSWPTPTTSCAAG